MKQALPPAWSRLKHYRIKFENRAECYATVWASSQDEAIRLMKENECDFGDLLPLEPIIMSIEVVGHG